MNGLQVEVAVLSNCSYISEEELGFDFSEHTDIRNTKKEFSVSYCGRNKYYVDIDALLYSSETSQNKVNK